MRRLPPLDEDLDPAEVIAALAPIVGAPRAARLDALAAARLDGVACVLEDLHDPHNAGAALRSCEAFGIQRVHLLSDRQRFRTSVRVTQGCERWLDVQRHFSVEEMVDAIRAEGLELRCAVPGAACRVDEIDPHRRVALAFGNEHIGVSPRLRALCDGEFSIPMRGAAQSLNVSVSVALSLYVAAEARRRALGRSGDLDAQSVLRLRARFYLSSVRGYRAIIERERERDRREERDPEREQEPSD